MRTLCNATIAAAALMLYVGMPQSVSAQTFELDDEGFLVVAPDEMAPEEGRRSYNIIGNPSEPGLYVLRIHWAPGTGSRPHTHDQARYIQVISGTWYVQTGEAARVYDPDSTIPVEAGTFIYEPADGIHYDMAKDEPVVVQIWGMGPVGTTSLPEEEAAR